MKTCKVCSTLKATEEFSKNTKSKDGMQSKCKACSSIASAAHYAKNKEHIASIKSAYRSENRVKIARQRALWHEKNKELSAVRSREWAKNNPEKASAKSRNRRAIKSAADGTHTAKDVLRIFDLQRGLCACCEARLVKSGKNKYHADHVMPLARGGGNGPDNIQILCQTCNVRKSAKDPIDWASENGKLL